MSTRVRGWPKPQRNKPSKKEILVPTLENKEKENLDKTGSNLRKQDKSFNRNKLELGRESKKKHFESVTSNDKDSAVERRNERDGQKDLELTEGQPSNNFVFLGMGRATKGNNMKKKEVSSKFPKFTLGQEEEIVKDKPTKQMLI